MRRCEGCSRPLPADAAPQRRYCDHEDCKQERDARRKALARERYRRRQCAKKYHVDRDGLPIERGKCARCRAYVRRPRQWWKVRPTRSLGASPNVDREPNRLGTGSKARSTSGQTIISHAGGPDDEDIYTLTTVGVGPHPSREMLPAQREWREWQERPHSYPLNGRRPPEVDFGMDLNEWARRRIRENREHPLPTLLGSASSKRRKA
jgi:hypothetical protein